MWKEYVQESLLLVHLHLLVSFQVAIQYSLLMHVYLLGFFLYAAIMFAGVHVHLLVSFNMEFQCVQGFLLLINTCLSARCLFIGICSSYGDCFIWQQCVLVMVY